MACPNDTPALEGGSNVNLTAVGIAMFFPTVLTLMYFVLLADFPSGVQQAVYAIGKCVQFAFPLAWVYFFLRTKPRWTWPTPNGVWMGLAFGILVLLAMFGLYFGWLSPAGHLQILEEKALEKVHDLGIDSTWKYAATGVFYSLVHSLLEEYYWRWFVFGQLRKRLSLTTSVVLSSLGFMAHHVILLGTFFGWDSPLGYIFSLAVAIGGVAWALIYEYSRSLFGPWLSHLVVDAAIFLVGYHLVSGGLG